MESARHLWHICYYCVECRFWASAFFQTKNPRSSGREFKMKPEFMSTYHQATQREIPSTSSQKGRTLQTHQKTSVPCRKFRKVPIATRKWKLRRSKTTKNAEAPNWFYTVILFWKRRQTECERLLDYLKRWCPSKKRGVCWKIAQKQEER